MEENNSDTELLKVEKKEKKIRHVSMKKSILIVSVAVILIAAIIAGYMVFGKKNDGEKDNAVVLYDRELSEVSKIDIVNKVSNDHIVLTSFMNGTVQEWNIEGQKYDDVNQTKAGYIAQFCKHLEANTVIENVSQMGEYGLNDPISTVNITYTDGSTNEVNVGGTYGSNEGAYVTVNGSKEVYVVSTYVRDYFTFSMADLLNLPSLSRTTLSAQTLYLFDKDRTLLELSYVPGPLSGTEAWYMLEPTISETDSDAIDKFFSNIDEIAFTSYYTAEAGEDLSVYGFTSPLYELQSYDDDKKLLDHFVIGGKVEGTDDTYYCALLGDGDEFATSPVYTLKADQAALLDVNAVDLASPYLVALNIYWLRHGEFTINGEKYELVIDRKTRYDDDGNVLYEDDGTEATENTYYLNGKQLDELQFKTFYSKVLFLSIEGIVPNDTPKGEELFSYSLEVVIPVTDYKTGESYEKEAVYEGAYYKISDTYAVFKNNESDNAVFTVRCRSIDSVAEALALLLEGRMPTA